MKPWCRRIAVLFVLVTGASPAARADDTSSAELVRADAIARDYYGAYLGEVLYGDSPVSDYRQLIAGDVPDHEIAARAAFRLVPWLVARGETSAAEEALAIGISLSRGDEDLLTRADRMAAVIDQGAGRALNQAKVPAAVRAVVASHGGQGIHRGPPAGAPVPGASAREIDLLREADDRLVIMYQKPLVPRLEGLSSSLRKNRQIVDSMIARYRELVARGGPIAVAAQLRIGTVLHDSALMMLVLPPELDAVAAAGLRRTLQRQALSNLQSARRAYQQAMARADGLPLERAKALARWRRAAESGKLAIDELLK